MTAVSFRPVEDGEIESLIALWNACDLLRPWNDPEKDIAFARTANDSDVLVMVEDEQVIASVMTGHDGHRGVVYYVAAHPDHRRRGLGSAAMQAAESWLKTRGVWKLNLLVRAENEAVRGFYEKLGYEVEPRLCMARKLIDS